MQKLSVDQALLKAKSYVKNGDIEEAQRIYQSVFQIYSKQSKNAQQSLVKLNKPEQNYVKHIPPQEKVDLLLKHYNQGQYSVVVEHAESFTKEYSESFVFWNILGASAVQVGMFEKAVSAFKKVISINPNYAEAYSNLGLALNRQGKLDEAVNSFKKAVSLNPNYADAFNNMGNALKDRGELNKAIEAYKKSISLNPNYAGAYYNIGNILKDKGKIDEAVNFFKKALSINPKFIESYFNMGNGLRDQGKLVESITAFNKALLLNPNYADAYRNMGDTLKYVIFKKFNPNLQNTIVSLLDQKIHVRPKAIASSVLSLLKLSPSLKKYLQCISVYNIKLPINKIICDLSKLTLLLKLMSVCTITDIEMECLLRKLRAVLLFSISSLKSTPEILRFQSALALQCFTNEFLYKQNEDEEKALKNLESKVKLALTNNKQQDSQSILCLASYKPLNYYDWCDKLFINTEIKEVYTRQVQEPKQEFILKSNFTPLKEIKNKISSKVRDQYEINPYPRWESLELPLRSIEISKVVNDINLNLFNDSIKEIKVPNILIAGCGTGQHSIETAARFKSSKVIAVDLSLSSLAYAKRKTKELGIQNIEYMHADILDLGKLDKQFDIIECVGVLHHMDRPIEGWKVLLDYLKPGGLMRIGLYSELARRHIVKIREEILKEGIVSNPTDMKLFRFKLMNSREEHHRQILNSGDFYSLSELRDLLFHIKEHRFTLPEIQSCLFKLNLQFCGFESKDIVSKFKLTHTNTNDCYNLNKWHAYEEANPRVFSSMYQFWCQKIC